MQLLQKISKTQPFGKYTYIKLNENENAELCLCYTLQLYKICIHIGKSGNTNEKCSLPLKQHGGRGIDSPPIPAQVKIQV